MNEVVHCERVDWGEMSALRSSPLLEKPEFYYTSWSNCVLDTWSW